MSTRNVLVDTSTLFSGLGWGGNPSRVLERTASEGFRLVVSDYIYDELFRHVSRKFEDDHRRARAIESLRYLEGARILTAEQWEPLLDDAEAEVGETKDAPVYAAYSHESVDLLVTSNTSDFPMDEQGVLTPAAFLERFEDS